MKLIPKFDASTVNISELPSVSFAERKGRLPNTPGIYFVLSTEGAVLYIGRAKQMRNRWCRHHASARMVAEAATIAWLTADDHYLLYQMEDACIEHFHPSLNQVPKPTRVLVEPIPRIELPQWVWDLVPDIDLVLKRKTRRKPKLSLGEGLREIQAVCLVSPEAGRKLRAYIDGLLDYWLDPPIATGKNITTITGEAGEEMATLTKAQLEEKPARLRRDQALTVRALIDEYIAALEQEFELRSESRFNSKRAG